MDAAGLPPASHSRPLARVLAILREVFARTQRRVWMLLTAIGRRLGVLAVAMGVFGSAELSADEPYLWRQAVIKGGGFVTGIYFHPANSAVVYIRTDMGGAYRL